MAGDIGPMMLNMSTAIVCGGLIGLERTYHGRPAGFRTHTLVCLASSLLMIVTVYHGLWFPGGAMDTVRIDPTRMAQGVMTGIGFLGAGVIVKEGLSVRGLTTAASIWITAAIGILAGVGFYLVALVGTVVTLAVLSLFRWVESRMPILVYANYSMKFDKNSVMPETVVRDILYDKDIGVDKMSYSVVDGGAHFEYLMTIRTRDIRNFQLLSKVLSSNESVIEYKIVPNGD